MSEQESGETRCKWCGHEKKWHGETGTCCFVLGGEPHWCVCDKFMPVETEICEGCEQPSNELRVSGDDVELCPECMNLDDIPATQREEASRDTQRRKGSMCIHCGRQTAHICPAFSGPSLPTEAAPEGAPQGEIPDDLKQMYFYMGMPSASLTEHNMGDSIKTLIERVGQAESALRTLREERDRALEALREVTKHRPIVTCNDFDHRRKDQHDSITPCPVLSRYNTAVEVADAMLAKHPAPKQDEQG
jgi:hypothetical protein